MGLNPNGVGPKKHSSEDSKQRDHPLLTSHSGTVVGKSAGLGSKKKKKFKVARACGDGRNAGKGGRLCPMGSSLGIISNLMGSQPFHNFESSRQQTCGHSASN